MIIKLNENDDYNSTWLTSELEDELYNEFENIISIYSWDSWNATGARDKEEDIPYICTKLNIDKGHEQEVYTLFWDWAHALEADDFPEAEEFYENPSELFDADYSNVIGVMRGMLDDLDTTDPDDKRLHDKITEFLKHPEQWEEIKQMSVDAVEDNDTIWGYILEYSCAELGEMDGIWNEFGDTINSVIYDYFS